MGYDRQIPNLTQRTGALSPAAPGQRLRYLGPASTIDVMFDQLEYLLAHESQECSAGCKDCERLKAVGDWLLLPFRTAGGSQGIAS